MDAEDKTEIVEPKPDPKPDPKPERNPAGVAVVELHERVARLEKKVLDTPAPDDGEPDRPELPAPDKKSDSWWW